jgi:hypothetical protein
MARNFSGNGAAELLRRTSVVSTATDNFTMSAWVYGDALNGTDGVYSNGEADGGGGTGYSIRTTEDTGELKGRLDLHFVANATGTTKFALNEWHHLVGIRRSGTSYIYTDGTQDGTTTNSNPNTPTNRYSIGAIDHSSSGSGTHFNGNIAECAFWNVALTDAEITILSKRYSPLFVRPASLISYIPCIGRFSPEIDIIGGSMTLVNSPPVFTHSPMIYLSTQQIIRYGSTAEEGGEVTDPVSWRSLLGVGL